MTTTPSGEIPTRSIARKTPGSLTHVAVLFAAALAVSASATLASAATPVMVKLWDKGGNMDMPTDLAYGTPGLDKSKSPMAIKVSRTRVPAGDVTFHVKNVSKETIHEMIVVFLTDPGAPLPYIEDQNRVDEEKVIDKGEVSELDPGKSGSLTLNLAPGTYLLICNVPGHYAAGMWTELTVSRPALFSQAGSAAAPRKE